MTSNLADAKKQGAVLDWGNFLALTLNLVIRLNEQAKAGTVGPAAPPKPTKDQDLLTEIRYSSRNNSQFCR